MGEPAERRDALAVTLTVAELEQRIEAAVARALQGQGQAAPANTQGKPKRWLNSHQLHETLGVSVRTIMNWIAAGCPHDRVGHKYRFDLAAVQEWLKGRRRR